MSVKSLALGVAALLWLNGGFAFAEGAIAVDDEAGSKPGDAGFGVGYGDSKESAQSAALKKCTSMGNDSCKVVVWYKKCGAYASSAEKFGIGYGSTEDAAKNMALAQCSVSSCKVVASDCDE
jgi:hypothetical protein